MVKAGDQQPPYVPATGVTTMMLPYGASFGAALGYEPFVGLVFCIAAGAYLSAKKAGMAFVEKAARRSCGPVVVMLGGPRRPVEEVQMSRLFVGKLVQEKNDVETAKYGLLVGLEERVRRTGPMYSAHRQSGRGCLLQR